MTTREKLKNRALSEYPFSSTSRFDYILGFIEAFEMIKVKRDKCLDGGEFLDDIDSMVGFADIDPTDLQEEIEEELIDTNKDGYDSALLDSMQMYLDHAKKMNPKNEKDKDHIWQALRKIQIIADEALLANRLK